MFAIRDFQYFDHEAGRSVTVRQGERVDGETLAKHKCNIEKLERTKFVAGGDAPSDLNVERLPDTPKHRKRGRPRKSD